MPLGQLLCCAVRFVSFVLEHDGQEEVRREREGEGLREGVRGRWRETLFLPLCPGSPSPAPQHSRPGCEQDLLLLPTLLLPTTAASTAQHPCLSHASLLQEGNTVCIVHVYTVHGYVIHCMRSFCQ